MQPVSLHCFSRVNEAGGMAANTCVTDVFVSQPNCVIRGGTPRSGTPTETRQKKKNGDSRWIMASTPARTQAHVVLFGPPPHSVGSLLRV